MGLSHRSRVLLAVLLGAPVACASQEGSEEVRQLLEHHAQVAREGAQLIAGALERSDLVSSEFGEGMQVVDDSSRALALLEGREDASDEQRLLAVLYQARAWDDAVRAIEGAALSGAEEAAELELFRAALSEKAFPARIAALNSFERAAKLACRLGLQSEPTAQEIADGISRYGSPTRTRELCAAH